MKKKRIGLWIVVVSLLIGMMWITACQTSSDQPTSTDQESDVPEVTSNSDGDSSEGSAEPGSDDAGSESGGDPVAVAQQDWQSSAHASSFVLDSEGNNNLCARCHAPKNWMPTMDDIPESCKACKFELAPPPPLIEESDWQHVSCVMCHQVDKKGNVQPEVSWLEIPALDEYVEIESPSELCTKCHTTEGIADHGQVLVGSGHADMQCLECHSPHSTTASCITGDCHSDVLSDTDQTVGHDEDHKDVSCAACHDSAGWNVGPHPETGIWVTFSPWLEEMAAGEEDANPVPFSSHDLGLEVNCERCHFSENPWGLTESVETP